MFVPRIETASETILANYSIYHLARLKASPVTRPLVAPFHRAHAALQKARAKERTLHEALQVAEAERDNADQEASSAIGRFNVLALSAVNKNRKAPAYVQYFPRGLTPIQEATAAHRLETLRLLLSKVGREPESSELKVGERDLLTTRDALQRTLAAVADAEVRHHSAHAGEVLQRGRWREAYQVSYARLLQLFPGHRRKVASFFRAGPKKKRRDATAKAGETR